MNKPLISVIIPVHNCEKTIGLAIDSIFHQTYENFEIVVVNDRSSDDTKKVVQRIARANNKIKLVEVKTDDLNRFDVKLNRNINAGYSARNTGFKHAQGEYITFQDADDTSLLNRIEVQYELLKKYNATHITTDWIRFDEKYIGKKFDIDTFSKKHKIEIICPEELCVLSQKTKGFVAKLSPALNACIPFHFKRLRVINKLFFGSLTPYPGAGNSPFFKREVIEKIKFRALKNRIWPSFMGRGADRDFNFQVAETFQNSYIFFIPLYLWRVENENERYMNKFII
jgi:glycosyltransferase involved in cell wall biosynthesis